MASPPRRRRPLAAIGGASARHPFVVLTVWLVVLAASVAFALGGAGGQTLFQRLVSAAPSVSGEAQAGQDRLASTAGTVSYTLLVRGVDVAAPQLTAIASELGNRVSSIPRSSYTDPLAVPLRPDGSRLPQLAPLFSPDGRGVLLTVAASGTGGHDPTDAVQKRVRDALDAARDQVR
ncbi:MAG TPA: hypothetical protein VN759_02770, partial [Pseudolysinimonas sp.]|nr:hypothetical protein [Pseudolysinimonas sp.]